MFRRAGEVVSLRPCRCRLGTPRRERRRRRHWPGRSFGAAPLEVAGQSLYTVQIPLPDQNLTYWLEYRQPIGFDAGLASYPNNGAQIRVASPFETLCSGCGAGNDDTLIKLGVFDAATAAKAFEQRLPIVPLMFRSIRLWHRTDVRGVSFDATGRPSFADLFLFGAPVPTRGHP